MQRDTEKDARQVGGDEVQTVQTAPIQATSRDTLILYYAIFVSFCCACANGYDSSLMTAILAMPAFQDTFHSGTTGAKVSVLFSMYTVGAMVMSPAAATLSDRLGRRLAMFCGAWVILVGMVLAATSSHLVQFIVGRFVLGAGIAVMTVAAPAYAMEIAPPQWRGRCTGFYNVGYFGGSIPAAAVTFGTNYLATDYAWRVPLMLQAVACLVVVGSVLALPESPRFLLANGHTAAAEAFLVRFHGNGDAQAPLVRREMAEMRAGIRQDGADKAPWDYRPLVATHSGRWRLAQVVLMSVCGQFSGSGLGYFNTVLFAALGIHSVAHQLAYNLLSAVLSALGAIAGAASADSLPRRRVLVLGSLACAACLAAHAGLSATLDAGHRPAYARGALASYLLFQIVFSFAYTPLQAVVPVEALETTTRAKGLALSNVLVNAVGFLNQFCGPIALGTIGYRYVLVFVGWDVVEALLWYLFGVEALGRTLEQLAWVYRQPNPARASQTPAAAEVSVTSY